VKVYLHNTTGLENALQAIARELAGVAKELRVQNAIREAIGNVRHGPDVPPPGTRDYR
jgi:hypothetical protein